MCDSQALPSPRFLPVQPSTPAVDAARPSTCDRRYRGGTLYGIFTSNRSKDLWKGTIHGGEDN
jgi:hypothetical protein